jgi:hypothetical protein
MMRPVTFATGVAFAASVLDPVMTFSVSGKAPLPLAAGRTGGLRSCKVSGPRVVYYKWIKRECEGCLL